MTVLVVAEHEAGALKAATLNTIAAAARFGEPIHVLVAGAGPDVAAAAAQASCVAGTAKALAADDPALADQLAEPLADLIVALAADYAAALAPATSFGKNVLPRAAALLDLQQISDVVAIEAADTFVRPIYAGNALATVRSSDRIKLLTVRATAFPAAAPEGGSGEIAPVAVPAAAGLSRFVGRSLAASERPELTAARVVISGGRGMAAAEHFHLLEKVADRLGGAVGASRAAVDAGYAANDLQVGQTGKIVAPALYLAVGISGAIQHLAGMKDSKVIVAINKDEEAPIFQVADYGLVADLFKALPELDAALASD